MTKDFKIVEIVEIRVDLGSEINHCLFPNDDVIGGNSFIIQCCVSGRHH